MRSSFVAEKVSMELEYLFTTSSILDEEVEIQLVTKHKNAFTKCLLGTDFNGNYESQYYIDVYHT